LEPTPRRGNHTLVSAVIADTGNLQVSTITKIAALALPTRVVMAAVPADADALPFFHPGTPTPTSSMTRPLHVRGRGILNAGPQAFLREHVAVAHATSLHLDSHVSFTGLGNFALDNLKL
jgi:hypothetical protein